jgi:hypothetical protein
MKPRLTSYLRATLLLCACVALTLSIYVAVVFSHGFGPDYLNFFSVNLPGEIPWRRSPEIIAGIFRDSLWIDPILCPLALLVAIGAALRARRLWSNPLLVASWIAIVCQAIFIFTRQNDYPPRYFLAMLAPIVIAIVLAVDEFKLSHAGNSNLVDRKYNYNTFIPAQSDLPVLRRRHFDREYRQG